MSKTFLEKIGISKNAKGSKNNKSYKYPGKPVAMDGNTAAIMCERESTDAAGAYPITPSTQMGEYWADAAAKGHLNISDRPLIFIEPEGEHAAAAVTAGLSMTGLRTPNFSSGQGIAYMHESLYAAVGKRLTYVLNVAREVGQHMQDYIVVLTKSTVPIGTSHKVKAAIQEELDKRGVDLTFDVASNPEFLKEGSAVKDFMEPDRIVVGTESERAQKVIERLYHPFTLKGFQLINMV